MSDREDRDQPEGVRILGAEEAQAALEGEGRVASDRGSGRGAGAGASDDPARPRRAGDTTWSASEQGEVADLDEQGELPVFPRPADGGEESDELIRPLPVEATEAP